MPTQCEHYGSEGSKRHLTIREFVDQCGPCRSRVYQLLNQGRIEGRKDGRLTLITIESAEKWAASLPPYQPAGKCIKRR